MTIYNRSIHNLKPTLCRADWITVLVCYLLNMTEKA